jgi:hypothetical protein
MRHLVGGDSYYLSHMTGDPARDIDTEHLDLHELRAVMEADEQVWIDRLGETSMVPRSATLPDLGELPPTLDRLVPD